MAYEDLVLQSTPLAVANQPAPAAGQRSAATQAYYDRAQAYAQGMRDKGFLVREEAIVAPDGMDGWETAAANNVPIESIFSIGKQFLTNKGNAAKVKRNKDATVWVSPTDTTHQYRIVNERGPNETLYTGTGLEGLTRVHDLASQLSTTQGKKADWYAEEYDPVADRWLKIADDDPPNGVLGKILDIALPIAASFIPGVGPVLGAALGSAASGTIQGRGIGDILKGAALAGGTAYLGGQVFGPAAGGGGNAAANAGGQFVKTGAQKIGGEAVSKLGGSALQSVGNSLASAGASKLGGAAVSKLGESLLQDIVVTGARQAVNQGAGAIGKAVTGLLGGVGGALAVQGAGSPQDIVVERPRQAIKDLDPGPLVAGGLTQAQLDALIKQLPTIDETTPEGKKTKDEIVKYLRLAGLGVGVIGNLFGGSGSGSGSNKIPGGLNGDLNPIFSGGLPTNPNIPGVGPASNLGTRAMPAQDWHRYGMRPEQSFYNYVPQRYTPPAPGVRDISWDRFGVTG